ncbi:MAG: nitroreductase [Rhodobacteraceae bacterium]|nr:nitroreductase [Paracoccaceae bacterium]
MPNRNPEALEFLLSRRSHPSLTLRPPVPTGDELKEILTAGTRVPDHGKLEPWRLIIIERPAMAGLAESLVRRGDEMGKAASLVRKAAEVFTQANLIVAVVSSPDREAKIPLIEQTLSAGAVCVSLVNAALAKGWGAVWVTGFGAHDRFYRESELGLSEHESIAGFIHIGTAGSQPPERPRPDLPTKVTNLSA